MKRVLVLSLLLAWSAAVLAQSAQSSQATLATQSAQAVTSNGPVTQDYNKTIVPSGDQAEANIAKQVRHELLKLPYYSVFDDLEYSVQGRTVTLSGAVTNVHSQTAKDAERAVKHIEGVDQVINNIRVLPPNVADEHARLRMYRALSRSGGLSQYLWPQAPAIRIVVDNQRVTLKGYVNSEGDKNLANIAANEVRDVFQVTNDLQVTK